MSYYNLKNYGNEHFVYITMVTSESIISNDMVGVEFEYNSNKYEVGFTTGTETGGKISIIHDNHLIIEKAFNNTVKQ